MKVNQVKPDQALETVMFNEQNSGRWKVLMQSDDPKAREAATDLLQDIRRVLGQNLTAATDAAQSLYQEIRNLNESAKAMGIDLPGETLH